MSEKSKAAIAAREQAKRPPAPKPAKKSEPVPVPEVEPSHDDAPDRG